MGWEWKLMKLPRCKLTRSSPLQRSTAVCGEGGREEYFAHENWAKDLPQTIPLSGGIKNTKSVIFFPLSPDDKERTCRSIHPVGIQRTVKEKERVMTGPLRHDKSFQRRCQNERGQSEKEISCSPLQAFGRIAPRSQYSYVNTRIFFAIFMLSCIKYMAKRKNLVQNSTLLSIFLQCQKSVVSYVYILYCATVQPM